MSKILQSSAREIKRSLGAPLLFATLSPHVQEQLRETALVHRFAPGAIIQQRGDDASGFWLIEEGTVAVGQYLSHGEFRAMGILGPGDSYGELAVLCGRPRIADAVARGPVVIRFIPSAAFESALAAAPDSMRTLLGGLAVQLQETLDMMAGIRRGTSATRTAAVLANLAGREATSGRRVAITQQEIGELLGVTRATAHAALRELEEAGLIRRAYGVIEVFDVERLRRSTIA